ncbi:hypothetical protein PG995_014923 [Apiospora arundinis]
MAGSNNNSHSSGTNATMPDGRVNYGGLNQSIHSSGGGSNQPYAQPSNQQHHQRGGHRGGRRNNWRGRRCGNHHHMNQNGAHQPAHNGASNPDISGQAQTVHITANRIQHGGLAQSVHSATNNSSINSANHAGQSRAIHYPASGTHHGGLSQSIHNAAGGVSSNASASTHLTNATPIQVHPIQASAQAHSSSIVSQEARTTPMVPEQPNPKIAAKVITLGSYYTLGVLDRDDLWKAMGLNLPKYPGHESWTIPFELPLKFSKLVLFGYNESCIYLDERFVRLVYRTHYDSNNNEVSHDLLLGPTTPSVDMKSLCFQNAMADAWWKLVRWMDRVRSGENLNLLVFLKAELKQELQQKKDRVL